MLRLIITLLFFSILSSNAQINNNGEFTVYNNGLIYSPGTMNQLTFIVDSLNLKFKRCDLTRPYYAKSQAIGNYLTLEKGNIKEALKDMAGNISFEDFLKKYKNAEADYRMLIVKYRYKESYSDKWVVEFSGETMTAYGGYEIRIEDDPGYYDRPLQGKWIVKHYDKDEYTEESLAAFYITNEFESQKIPEKYARMILYSDCVIDTTADIFTEKAKRTGLFEEETDKNYRKTKLFVFNNYLEQNTKHITEKKVPVAYGKYKWMALDSMKRAWINQKLVSTEKFKQLLTDAVNEAKQKQQTTTDEFENYVATYVSKADALELKRNRRVMGMCSMDQSPRYHALNIAMLSAETVNWQVFLRAHLNIMNDRFERATDGSYAWAQRQTYIKELEELNIEVQELLLGISFRIENPVDKHYYGSINRLGRALSETKKRAQFENEVLNIIKDGELDAYNRMLMHYLYLNYIYYLPEKETRLAGLAKLEEADRSLPDFFRLRIKIDKKNFETTD